MKTAIYQCDLVLVKIFLQKNILSHTNEQALKWVAEKLAKVASQKDFFFAFSSTPRFAGKEKLNFSHEELKEADSIRIGWNPASCTVDRAVRILLVLSFPHNEKESFLKTIETLFSSADMNELVALYSVLPLFPFPEDFRTRAAEGVRTNIRDVFDSCVLDNPFTSEFFSEEQWNQMVLKAVFTRRPLYKIYGIDERRNKKLAEMLIDFAHERWAAGRTVTPELWRCVAPFVNEINLSDVKKLGESADENERFAFTLLRKRDSNISWNTIGKNLFSTNS